MTNIESVIKKYDKNYVPGERRSREYEKKKEEERRLHERLMKAEPLMLNMKLNPRQIEGVKYFIHTFKNFKELHRRLSDEGIIICFCLYFKKLDDSRLNIDSYRVCKQYNVNSKTFELVCCRIIQHFTRNYPIQCTSTNRFDHEELSKNGGVE